jgi:hypothetical protein
MSAITEEVVGILLVENDRTALALIDRGQRIYLRYGLQTFAEDLVILPELLLDDWGREIRGLDLYKWLQESGQRFPRAELFGYDPAGASQQYFLREIDLVAKYPSFAYISRDSPVKEGRLLTAALIPTPGMDRHRQRRRTPDIVGPLSNARVDWWEISPAEIEAFSFAMLEQSDEKAGAD